MNRRSVCVCVGWAADWQYRKPIYPHNIKRLRDTLHKLRTYIPIYKYRNNSGSSSYRIVRSLCFTCTLKCNKIKTSSLLLFFCADKSCRCSALYMPVPITSIYSQRTCVRSVLDVFLHDRARQRFFVGHIENAKGFLLKCFFFAHIFLYFFCSRFIFVYYMQRLQCAENI